MRLGSSLAGLPSTTIKTMQKRPTSSGSNTTILSEFVTLPRSLCFHILKALLPAPLHTQAHNFCLVWVFKGKKKKRREDICEVELKKKKVFI